MAVFPPTEEFTWDKSVVGICTKFIPLLNILAAYPAKSPITPPPVATIQSFLLKLFLDNKFVILVTCVLDLILSPSGNIKVYVLIFFKFFFNLDIYFLGIFLVVIIKILWGH